jgi:hypothetical protein
LWSEQPPGCPILLSAATESVISTLARDATPEERQQGAPARVLDVNPSAAPFAREAFARAAAGASIRSVTRWICSLPGSAGRPRGMTATATRRMLSNPTYRAITPDGTQARWPALIDERTWNRVQERIAGHVRQPHQASGRFLLTGLLRCSRCGDRMYGADTQRPGKDTERIYRCRGRDRCECTYRVRRASVDATVRESVAEALGGLEGAHTSFRAAVRQAWQQLQQPQDSGSCTSRRAVLEREVVQARKRLTDAALLLVDGILDREGYERVRDQAQADLEQAERHIAQLQPVSVPVGLPPLDEVLYQAGGWATALEQSDIPAQRDVLGLLITKVVAIRITRGRYETRITWSTLGNAVREVAQSTLVARSA